MFGGFGVPITPQSLAQVTAKGTPIAGDGSEVIFHQMFDTQQYVSATTTKLSFFSKASDDTTITNLEQPSQLPDPQTLQIYNITCDILPVTPVTLQTAVGPLTTAGVLTDMANLLMSAGARPTWTLTISNKTYGPYSLTALHGTGGPDGVGYGSSLGTSSGSIQYARNTTTDGWNYWGNIILTQRASFSVKLNWATAVTLGTDLPYIRISMFGIMNRAVK